MPLFRLLRSIANKITGSEPKPQSRTTKKTSDDTRQPEPRRKTKNARAGKPTENKPERTPSRPRQTAPTGKPNERHPRRNAPAARDRNEMPARERNPRRTPPPQTVAVPPAPSDVPWNPAEFAVEPAEGKKRFHDFDLPESVMHAIYDAGFQYCTPIQAETLNQTMAGANVAGKAQTGTGKTAAYLIAMLQRMINDPESRPTKPGRPAALIIAPTRELVMQAIKDADELGKYAGLRAVAVYGGMDYAGQQNRLEAGPVDLIAATPGRLLDFVRSRIISLKDVKTLVIDEADRMLDMGFIPDVTRIIRELPGKDARQTLLFSATLNDDVMRLAAQWMPNPIEVSVDSEHATVDTINQVVYPIAAKEKFKILYNTLKAHPGKRFLIFRNRKRGCDDLCRQLARYDIDAQELSGDIDQKKRIRILEDFRAGKTNIVVATDVAGRGIHVDDIAYVVNYDFPYEADDYIHRIGRTGRAGTTGTAISFACEDESFIIPDVEKLLGEVLHCQQPEETLFSDLPAQTRTVPRKPFTGSGNTQGRPGGRRTEGPRRGRSSLSPRKK